MRVTTYRKRTVGTAGLVFRLAIMVCLLLPAFATSAAVGTSAAAPGKEALAEAQSGTDISVQPAGKVPAAPGTCETAGPIEVEASAGTVGPTQYVTLEAAFTQINAGTHQGTITIDVCGNTTETTSAVLTASGVGSSSYTSISISPVGGPRTITGSIVGAIIKLNGADNVTIDGRIGGTGRNLSVINTSTASATAAVWLASVAAGNGASNNVIRNLELAAGVTQNTAILSTFGIIMSGPAISTTSNGVDNDNNQFVANRIIRARYGILTRGTTTDLNINPVVTDNIIGPSAFGTDQIGKDGIFMQADTGATVSRNTVQFVGGDIANTTSGTDRCGICIGTDSWSATDVSTLTSNNYSVTRNVVQNIVEERAFSSIGIKLGTTGSGSATNNLVANNFIINVRANGTTGDQLVGIGIAGGNADKVVFNSISITGDVDPTGASSSSTYGNAIRIPGANGANNANFTVMNNSVYLDVNSNTAANHYYDITLNSAAYSFGTGGLNYNNYYINAANPQLRTGGLGTGTGNTPGTEFATLANWQAALTTPQDANSIQADPLYLSNTSDLHISSSSPNESAGVAITGVTDDIDGEARPATPDIGADEISPSVGPGVLQFSSSAYNVVENGGTATITVNRSGGSSGTVMVDYATVAGGTATGGASCGAGVDYVTTSGTLTFGPGVTSQTFTVTICDETFFEGNNETINLQLSNPTGGATLGTQSTAVLTITENDPSPGSVQFTSATFTVAENVAGGVVNVTASRTGGSAGQVTVDYVTANGTATGGASCDSGVDYITQSGTLLWADGDTANKTIAVTICDDAEFEGNETFTATLSNPQGTAGVVTLGSPSTTTVTITENDAAPNDTCAVAQTLSLNLPVRGSTGGGTANDYQLSAPGSPTCFTGVGQTATTAPGRDVVYSFTPATASTYSFRVTNYSGGNPAIYLTSICPAATPGTPVSITCQTPDAYAANRTSTGTFAAEEINCVSLAAGTTYFLFVDESSLSTSGSAFTVEVNPCTGETESNNTPETANAYTFGVEGAITPAGEADFFSLGTPAAGSRVFAMADSIAAGSNDFDMRITSNTTINQTLEYDASDLDSPFGSLAPDIAGTTLNGNDVYIRMNRSSSTTVNEPYRLYAVVQPSGVEGTESEPNETLAQADFAASNYFSGTLASTSDTDVFRLTANDGDLIMINLDEDPARDSTAFDGQLELLDAVGNVLVSVDSTSTTSSSGTPSTGLTASSPTSPGEALVYRVPASTMTARPEVVRSFYARITAGGSTTGDYLLSMSLNGVVGNGPTVVKLASFNATQAGDGTLIEWKTGYEANNLGFNLYREVGGKRTLVNPSMVAGTAFTSKGGHSPVGAGYAWWDAGTTGKVSYWLEDVDASGKATMHGPITPSSAKPGQNLSKQNRATLLSELGQSKAASKPVEARAALPQVSAAGPQSITNLAGGAAVKLSVKSEGWYRLTQPQLLAAGLDANVDPRNIQVYVDGAQLPVLVRGESDGTFDLKDTVEFYGLGTGSPYSDARVYWLVATKEEGQRIVAQDAGGTPTQGGSFPYTIERRDRTIYFPLLLNGDTENFFGAVVYGTTPTEQTLSVTNRASGDGRLDVTLQGASAPAHRVGVKLNGTQLGEINFAGHAQGTASFPVSAALLQAGENRVTLTALGGGSDISLVDNIRLTYNHTYTAEANTLKLTAQGGQTVTVGGFSSATVRVVDVTEGGAPRELLGNMQPSNGGYSVTVVAQGTGHRTLLAFADGAASAPASVVANTPSAWRNAKNNGQLVILGHSSLLPSFSPLRTLRESQGMVVASVDVEDIYDEFSYGQKTPYAVKSFLEYAQANWTGAPRYVLLAGDASLDPRNYLGASNGNTDFVPTKLLDTQYMETASDDWLADSNNDGLAELAVGRLPARTSSEAARMVGKVVGYDSGAAPQGGVALVSDRTDSASGFSFEAVSARLREMVPAGVAVEQINRGERDPQAVKAEIIAAINRGQRIVNYVGHGSVNLWGGSVFTNEDAAALTNGRNLPLFVGMTCLNGYFQDPSLDSLGEALLKAPNGGAVAAWSSSGMTTPDGQSGMNVDLYSRIFSRQAGPRAFTLGEMTSQAKASTQDLDVRQTWILLGDPSMMLR